MPPLCLFYSRKSKNNFFFSENIKGTSKELKMSSVSDLLFALVSSK